MSLRIRFSGQEYPSLEAMPANVRAAYQQRLEALSRASLGPRSLPPN